MTNRSRRWTAFAALIVLSFAAPTLAQPWPFGRSDRQQDQARQAGYDNGYRMGALQGERDARSSVAPDFRRDRVYRDADAGYRGSYGSRGQYQQVFRDGFQRGYRDGYARYQGNGRGVQGRDYPGDDGRYGRDPRGGAGGYGNGGYGTNNGYSNRIAFDNGYRDGLEKGGKDARDRKSFDVARHGWYRDGDHRYDHDYGPKDIYRQGYRDGFRQGYEAAYRQRGYDGYGRR